MGSELKIKNHQFTHQFTVAMQIMNLLKIHAFHRYNFETFYCQVEQYLHCYAIRNSHSAEKWHMLVRKMTYGGPKSDERRTDKLQWIVNILMRALTSTVFKLTAVEERPWANDNIKVLCMRVITYPWPNLRHDCFLLWYSLNEWHNIDHISRHVRPRSC